ncbi:YhgE/Pip domain-containing protein [Priestia sp. GS2]|uniref:YhgE/Pip domain-containing protein n=1 Tax=Priestia sp. GS2 TaxID=3117403 RepID=UPI002ED8B42C
MKFLKQKLFLLSPILVLTVVLIFSLTLVPSVNPSPRSLPIAIVNEDEGFDIRNKGKINMGNTFVEKIGDLAKKSSGEVPVIHWIKVPDKETVIEGLNNQKYYAAMVITKGFSQKQASLQTPNPSFPNIEILINEGMNATAAKMAGQMLKGITDNLNKNLSSQLLAEFEKQGGEISTKQASVLAAPINVDVTNINAVGLNSANGNAPVSFIQPLWMSSIIGAAIVFISINKVNIKSRRESFLSKLILISIGAILAIIVGFGLISIVDNWLGFHVPNFNDTALFVALSYFSFFMLISAVTAWFGIKGIGIFALLFFFGVPLLSMPPEFMSAFYRDWIYYWLPMRFSVEGLRELLYFGSTFSFDGPSLILLIMASLSVCVILLSALKPVQQKGIQHG